MNMLSYQCRDSNYKDKTVSRPSDLYNGNSLTRQDHLYIETGHRLPFFVCTSMMMKCPYFHFQIKCCVHPFSQWETTLQCNIVSHWLRGCTKWFPAWLPWCTRTRTIRHVTLWVRCLPLQWRHNGRDGVSNHQPYNCLLDHLFRRRSKKTSKLRVTGLCEGNSPVTGEFPAQMTSNSENVPIWWRHHAFSAPARATMAKSVVYVYEGEGVSSTALLMLMASLQEAVDHSKHGIKLISPQEVKQGGYYYNVFREFKQKVCETIRRQPKYPDLSHHILTQCSVHTDVQPHYRLRRRTWKKSDWRDRWENRHGIIPL